MAEVQLVPTEFFLGLPWYMWAMVGMGGVVMAVMMIFILYWYMMGPCRSYFPAQLHGDDITLFAQKSGKLKFSRADYVTKIFNSIDLPLSWIQRANESFRFGKCMAKIVTDATGICTEPTVLQGIKQFVFEWNALELEREAWAKSNGGEYIPDLITEYNDLYRLIKNGKVDDPVVIPAVFEVPLWQMERYLAHIGPGDLEGHIATRVADETEKQDSSEWPTWVKGFLAVEVGVAIFYLGIYLITNRGG